MASRDRPLLEALRQFLGFGSIRDPAIRRAGWLPTSVFTINSFRGHRLATIPFADRFLLPSAKRTQFERWREALERYEREHDIRPGRSTCSVEGCGGLVRGRGLCRAHYYRATGH
jgi:hypothetical protein